MKYRMIGVIGGAGPQVGVATRFAIVYKALENGMKEKAEETGIPVEVFRFMYRQLSYSPVSVENNGILCRLVYMLMDRYPRGRGKVSKAFG